MAKRRSKILVAGVLAAAVVAGTILWQHMKSGAMDVDRLAGAKVASTDTPPDPVIPGPGNLNVSHGPSYLIVDFQDTVEPGMLWAARGPYTDNTDFVSVVYSMEGTMAEVQTENILFFIRHGLQTNVDYVFVLNGDAPRAIVEAIPRRNNVFIVHKDNSCFDLGSHPIGVDFAENRTGKRYQRLALLNSSVRGPFLPPYVNGCWNDQFFKLLDDKVKLVGTVHGCLGSAFMMQSMALAYDRVGFDISRNGTLVCRATHEKTWMIGEAGNLQRINQAGYEGKFLSADAAHRGGKCTPGDDSDSGFRYGEHQPTEILFWKTNRGQSMDFMKRLTKWHDSLPSRCPYHIPVIPYPRNNMSL